MKILSLMLMIGLLLATAACDDAFIDPFDNDERYYTIYGFLDVRETEHAVRVIPVTRFPERITTTTGPQAFIDAMVTSTDLHTGETILWRHSLDKLSDGTYGHIYRATFIVQTGRTYRLEVQRSDGKTASAETRVPYISEAAYYERGPVEISLDSSVVTQEIYIPNVPSLWNIEAVYLMSNEAFAEGTLNGRFFIPYGRAGVRTDDGGWRFTLQISEDQTRVRAEIDSFRQQGVYDNSPLVMESMGVQIRILDANWDPPEGVFDPEVLAQPGTLSNVENGHGFWGSVGLYRQEWQVSPAFSRMLGYRGGGNRS